MSDRLAFGLCLALLFVWSLPGTITLRFALLLAALGELYSERSGVLNIGLEGIMLIGAFTAVAATNLTQNPWLGLGAAIVSGILLGLIHAVVCVTFKSNQIISGIAINIFADGATIFYADTLADDTWWSVPLDLSATVGWS
mgnify:CR=1 FL=1